jgi:hypothetical protein
LLVPPEDPPALAEAIARLLRGSGTRHAPWAKTPTGERKSSSTVTRMIEQYRALLRPTRGTAAMIVFWGR